MCTQCFLNLVDQICIVGCVAGLQISNYVRLNIYSFSELSLRPLLRCSRLLDTLTQYMRHFFYFDFLKMIIVHTSYNLFLLVASSRWNKYLLLFFTTS